MLCFKYLINTVTFLLEYVYQIVALLLRVWVFLSFYPEGLVKFSDFYITKFLFMEVYKVTWLPLPPAIASYFDVNEIRINYIYVAYIVTAIQLTTPIFIVFGLAARFMSLILLGMHYVVTVSYLYIWLPEMQVELWQNIFLGMVLLCLVSKGPGNISLDGIIAKRTYNYLY